MDFEKYTAPVPDPGKYLERIGLEGIKLDGTLETLNKIMEAHLLNIPYENLDVWNEGRIPSLEVEALFDKMILHRRGGWCHELNGLFHAFLSTIGYDVYSVGARVRHNGICGNIGHHGVICRIDGRKYYCDVGFGNTCLYQPIALDGTPNAYGFYAEKLAEDGGSADIYYIMAPEDFPREDKILIKFTDAKLEPYDYVYLNYANAANEDELFRRFIYISRIFPGSRKMLFIDKLTETRDGVTTLICQTSDRGEILKIAREHFGIEY